MRKGIPLLQRRTNCKNTRPLSCIAFLPLVVQGEKDTVFSNALFSSLCEINGKDRTVPITSDSALKMISGQTTNLQYVLFVKRYEDITNTLSGKNFNFMPSSGNEEKVIYTVCEIAIVDLLKKEILFSTMSNVKKNVGKRENTSIVNLILTQDQKKSIIDSRTDKAINRNTERTVKNLMKDLSGYLSNEKKQGQ